MKVKKLFFLVMATLIHPMIIASGAEQADDMQDVVLTWKSEALDEAEGVVGQFYKNSALDRAGLFLHAVGHIDTISDIISSCKQSGDMTLSKSLDQQFNTSFFSYIRHDIPVYTFYYRKIGLLVDWSRIYTHIGVHEENSEPVKIKESEKPTVTSKAGLPAPALPTMKSVKIQQKQIPVADSRISFFEDKIRYFPDIHLNDQQAGSYPKNQKLLGNLGLDTFDKAAYGLNKLASQFLDREKQSKHPGWAKKWNEIRTSAIPCDAYVGIYYMEDSGTTNQNSLETKTRGYSVSDQGLKFTKNVHKKLFSSWSQNISETLPVYRYSVNSKNTMKNNRSVAHLKLDQMIGLDD